jgi:wyosine [tRNA(Phe)-imidazoG37] synthetase (radical SAM superfamily)
MQLSSFCAYPFDRIRVTAEGNVAFCCFMRPDPNKPASPYLGNLLENTFDQIWFGEAAEKIRVDTESGVLSEKCKNPGCPFMSCRLIAKKVIYNEYPQFLEIDLPNTHCNVGGIKPTPSTACVMCERASPLFQPEKDRLLEVLSKIKHLVCNLKQIHIQGIAEPFWKDLIFEMLDVLHFDNHKSIIISTTTNGTLLGEPQQQRYLARVPHSITNFSIDASTPETYKAIRRLDIFPKVLENLRTFDRKRDKNQQFLQICNNINLLNIHEVIGMVHLARDVHVNALEFNATDGYNREILVNEQNCGRFYRAQQDIVEECQKLGIPVNFVCPLDKGLTNSLLSP